MIFDSWPYDNLLKIKSTRNPYELSLVFHPFSPELVEGLAALLNPEKRSLMDFYESQIRFLLAHLPKRPTPTLGEKMAMARSAAQVGRNALKEVLTLFTPDTLFRWHRELIRQKWDYSKKRGSGRPITTKEIESLVIQFAQENKGWGYHTIQKALQTLGFKVCQSTIRNILQRNGLTPSPERKKGMPTFHKAFKEVGIAPISILSKLKENRRMFWKEFCETHWEALVGCDFFTWEVWTPFGLITYYVLFLIHQASRQVHLAGITTNPDGDWMKQIAKNLTMPEWGWPALSLSKGLKKGQIVLHDRDGKFCPAFRAILESEGIRTLMLPFQSPNLNAYAERWVRSVKEECLSKMIILREPMLRKTLKNYLEHFLNERNHQGLGRIPFPAPEIARGSPTGKIVRRQHLGGLRNFYFREAA
jgi:putative transposase